MRGSIEHMISLNSVEKSMTDWFLFEVTDDSSFTMRFIDPETGGLSECMHSLRGAFSETDYIYGHAIRTTIAMNLEPQFLSVGLGLGYCEILLAALMFRNFEVKSFEVESFEVDSRLRSQFLSWIKGEVITPEFQKVYDQTLKSSAELCRVDPVLTKRFLSRIKIRELLTSETEFAQKFSCVLFDAFSSKSTPELWTEEFLMNFFEKACAPKSVFATYACTGVLKRALKNSGFEVQIRPGFSSKRDSTFAVRG
jgi:hypothetical protein